MSDYKLILITSKIMAKSRKAGSNNYKGYSDVSDATVTEALEKIKLNKMSLWTASCILKCIKYKIMANSRKAGSNNYKRHSGVSAATVPEALEKI